MQAIYNLIQKSLTQTRCLAKWRTVRVSFGKEYQKCGKILVLWKLMRQLKMWGILVHLLILPNLNNFKSLNMV